MSGLVSVIVGHCWSCGISETGNRFWEKLIVRETDTRLGSLFGIGFLWGLYVIHLRGVGTRFTGLWSLFTGPCVLHCRWSLHMGHLEVMVGSRETYESGFMMEGWPRRLLKRGGKDQEGKKETS